MKFNISIFIGMLFLGFSATSVAKTLNRGNGSEPDSLNIHLAEGLNSHNILRDMYEGLMTLDANGKPIYGAAVAHTVTDNIWQFKLRENAKWSDGSAVVADDFVRAWGQAIDPKTAAGFAFLLQNIIGAKAIMQGKSAPETLAVIALDAQTLEIRLEQYDAAFLEKLSLPIFFPLPKPDSSTSQIISNGPYQLHDWVVQEKITLQKNPYYYDKDSVYFEQVNYWVTEDQSSELKRFRARQLDITESIPDSQIDWIKQNLNAQLHIHPYLGSFFLGLNIGDEHLQNPDLRQALALAINRQILTDKVLKTGQQPALHIIPRNLLDATTATAQPLTEPLTDAQRTHLAQSALQKSGISKHDLNIEILYNNSENQRKVAIAIAAMWRQTLGIRTHLRNQEWKVFVQSRKSESRQAFRSGWIADYADALSFLQLFTSQSRFNFYHYKNLAYDQLVALIDSEADRQQRFQLIQQAENMLLHDMPVIPLYYYVSRHLVNSRLSGYVDNIADRHLSRYLTLKED